MRVLFLLACCAMVLLVGGCEDAGGGENSGGACSPTATPANTSTECPAGEICRHFAVGDSRCVAYGSVCADHNECCNDCVCLGGTCIETVFVNFHDIDCDTDADCPVGTECITRNYGSKKCAIGH